jgi:hypothetical protein
MLPRLLIFASLVWVALVVYALVEAISTPKHLVRALPKAVWVVAILVFPFLGSVLWFLLGRNRSGKGRPAAPRRAPDDDPNFLSTLGESADDRIARLEEELRKLDDEGDSATGNR